ncbi:ABC transporter permease [Oleiharenicola lentus]|uniref:ABC transporter permease n=1 Tax=Oleiharenicola lentus TaxID=2508720 RepID=UPI003F669C11
MHPILVLLRKDFRLFFRDKASVMLTFIIPFALIYLFGQVFGVNRQGSGPSSIPIAVVNQSDNPAAQSLVEALKKEKTVRVLTNFVAPDKSTRPLTEEDLRPLMKANEFRFALVIPRDLIRVDDFGIRIKILSDPRNEIETQTVNGILQKTIYANVPQLLGQSLQNAAKLVIGAENAGKFNAKIASAVAGSFGGDAATIQKNMEAGKLSLGGKKEETTKSGENDFFSQLIEIENEQVVGQQVKSPGATRIVGGWAMQFLLFALSGSAVALFYERDQGLFQRMLSAPVTRAHILWSKFLYGVALGLIQLLVLFFAGRVLFGIEVENHFGLLTLVCVFAAAACTAFGMLLAAFAPSPEAARGMATFLILMMSAIGGAWFPVSFMPEFIQQLSKFTLVYWSMEGFTQVLWADATFTELLTTLGVLAAITVGVMAVAVWRFNRGQIFS